MNHEPECYRPEQTIIFPCICDRLRACEQRVTRTLNDHYWTLGVQAAREVVEATAKAGLGQALPPCEFVHTRSALAAIDALGINNV